MGTTAASIIGGGIAQWHKQQASRLAKEQERLAEKEANAKGEPLPDDRPPKIRLRRHNWRSEVEVKSKEHADLLMYGGASKPQMH